MSRLLAAVKTQPDRVIALNYAPVEVDRQYRYWRGRILLTSIIGYALYYFVRSNISLPLKSMGTELGYSKEQLGLITSIGGGTYGILKFMKRLVGHQPNPRVLKGVGLFRFPMMETRFLASLSV